MKGKWGLSRTKRKWRLKPHCKVMFAVLEGSGVGISLGEENLVAANRLCI